MTGRSSMLLAAGQCVGAAISPAHLPRPCPLLSPSAPQMGAGCWVLVLCVGVGERATLALHVVVRRRMTRGRTDGSKRPRQAGRQAVSQRTAVGRGGFAGRSSGRHPKPPLAQGALLSGRLFAHLSSFPCQPCHLGRRARASVLPTPWNAAMARPF